MSILERDHQSAHWRGCYEEHLGCANARLEEARSHANYLAETLQSVIEGRRDMDILTQAMHALTKHKEWEESQP